MLKLCEVRLVDQRDGRRHNAERRLMDMDRSAPESRLERAELSLFGLRGRWSPRASLEVAGVSLVPAILLIRLGGVEVELGAFGALRALLSCGRVVSKADVLVGEWLGRSWRLRVTAARGF